MIKLKIIHASTRDVRRGIAISKWLEKEAANYEELEVELIDLKELDLPFFNEPKHPRLKDYSFDFTKAWSAKVEEADAFIFVTCEYNYGMPATFKNAFDYLMQEWAYKPAALVGYGGIAGGVRAMEQIKLVASSPRMLAFEGMQIPAFTKYINENEEFIPTEKHLNAAGNMFKELLHLGEGMKVLRK